MIVDVGARRAVTRKSPGRAPDAPARHQARPGDLDRGRRGSWLHRGHGVAPGGTFLIGSDDRWAYRADGEGPVRRVSIGSFWIDRHAVSNARFGAFVEATGYVTEAGRFGWSFVFAGLLPDDFPPTEAVVQALWWRKVEGADWQHPEGPQSSLDGSPRSPRRTCLLERRRGVLHLDGQAPTDRGRVGVRGPRGLDGKAFPWGDEREPDGEHQMNVWQGAFPTKNTNADGYYGTCPVDAFPPNAYGLHNVTGNVWEWAADWFDPGFRKQDRDHDPHGPAAGTLKIQKGGSYLCHDSYCRRYRVAARQGNSPDSSTANVGFRCARDG